MRASYPPCRRGAGADRPRRSDPRAHKAPAAGDHAAGDRFTVSELVNSGHAFFGSVSRGLAQVIEKAVSQWGLPNGYVLGEEAGGAFVAGLRYGDGVLYTKNAGDLKVYWQGPSVGWDFGGDGARTMMLVYNLPATEAIYERFGGVDGSAYFVGGVRHDRADQRQRGGGSDPLRRRAAPRRQRRLSEVHAQADLEPALSARLPGRLPV